MSQTQTNTKFLYIKGSALNVGFNLYFFGSKYAIQSVFLALGIHDFDHGKE